jgi:hypothetical protein
MGKNKAFDGSAVMGEFFAKSKFGSLENITLN